MPGLAFQSNGLEQPVLADGSLYVDLGAPPPSAWSLRLTCKARGLDHGPSRGCWRKPKLPRNRTSHQVSALSGLLHLSPPWPPPPGSQTATERGTQHPLKMENKRSSIHPSPAKGMWRKSIGQTASSCTMEPQGQSWAVFKSFELGNWEAQQRREPHSQERGDRGWGPPRGTWTRTPNGHPPPLDWNHRLRLEPPLPHCPLVLGDY